jgi:hypothetical protein
MKSREFMVAGTTLTRRFWEARIQLKRIQPLLFVFLMSTLFFPFLRVSSLQNDNYQLVSSSGTVDYPLPPIDYPPLTVLGRLWSDDSYWYKKIPQNAPLHPDSEKMVEWLINTDGHNDGHPVIHYKAWTKPVYEAYQDTPTHNVYYQDGTREMFTNVRIPLDAQPATDLDGGLTIIDWYGEKVWDFWQLAYQNGKWTAGDGYGYDLYSDGIAPNRVWTCGGSSTPMLGILIRPEEIEAGVINHPLGCCLHTPKKGEKVYPPAATTDGKSNDMYAIPEGARIQLDPNLDLDSLSLSRTAKIIAKCMQEYGIVVKESGGSWGLYAEHTYTADWSAWGLTGGILMSLPAQWRIVDYSVFGAVEEEYP